MIQARVLSCRTQGNGILLWTGKWMKGIGEGALEKMRHKLLKASLEWGRGKVCPREKEQHG